MVRFLKGIKLIWTGESIVFTAYEKIFKQVKSIKHTIKAMSVTDNTFCAKILYAGEIRIKFWANDLSLAETREEVNDSILDFSAIISSIKLKSFSMELPPCFDLAFTEEEEVSTTSSEHDAHDGSSDDQSSEESIDEHDAHDDVESEQSIDKSDNSEIDEEKNEEM